MITTLVYREHKYIAANPPPGGLAALKAEPGVMLWVDLSDPGPEEIRLILEEVFQFHPLAIEDCVADSPFPKLEDYEDYLYLVMHAVDYTRSEHFTTTELDLFLGANFLVTFHRKPLKPVQAAIDRCQRATHTLVRGPDRLAHQLLDLLVEAYKPALIELQGDLDTLENDSLGGIQPAELFPRLLALRKEFAALSRIVRPQRELVTELTEGKKRIIRPVIVPYLRDLAEELARIETQSAVWTDELMLSFRVYLNRSAYEANEGVKVLTGITALTIPVLTIGAWYGMNFEHMPELEQLWTYPLFLTLMFGGTFAILKAMRNRKWI
jgi:magnesium transporter